MLMKSKFIVAEYYHTRLAGNDVWRATPFRAKLQTLFDSVAKIVIRHARVAVLRTFSLGFIEWGVSPAYTQRTGCSIGPNTCLIFSRVFISNSLKSFTMAVLRDHEDWVHYWDLPVTTCY
jgi:hypothetical protein